VANPVPIVGAAGVDYNPTQNADRNFSNGFANGVLSGAGINYNPTQNADRNYTINVTTGIGDPNAIAEAVNQVIQDAVDRGTLRGGAY
jgi:hypothetical protein